MTEIIHTIQADNGIHARPAGQIVKIAEKYSSKITIHKESAKGDAKSIFSLMSLAVKKGDTIKIIFEGNDEESAKSEMYNYIIQNL